MKFFSYILSAMNLLRHYISFNLELGFSCDLAVSNQVELCDDDDFLVVACDGIW